MFVYIDLPPIASTDTALCIYFEYASYIGLSTRYDEDEFDPRHVGRC